MHEFSVVESVVQELLAKLAEQKVKSVESVRFRRGSAFAEGALVQAFRMLSAGTPLEGARLDIDTVNLDFNCGCGHSQVITADDLIGHMFVCPGCGATRECDESHDLELVEITGELSGAGGGRP